MEKKGFSQSFEDTVKEECSWFTPRTRVDEDDTVVCGVYCGKVRVIAAFSPESFDAWRDHDEMGEIAAKAMCSMIREYLRSPINKETT